jgi:hypothetical protein
MFSVLPGKHPEFLADTGSHSLSLSRDHSSFIPALKFYGLDLLISRWEMSQGLAAQAIQPCPPRSGKCDGHIQEV